MSEIGVNAEVGVKAEVGIKEKAVAGMLWLSGVRLSTQIFDQAFTIVLARLLVPGDFGLIAMTAVFTRLLSLFADMGLGRAVIQRKDVDEELLSTAFWGNLVSGLALTGIGLVASRAIAGIYDQPLAGPLFATMSLRFALSGANVTQAALLQRDLRYATVAWRNVIGVLIGGVVGVSLALSGAGVWSLIGQVLATDLARTALLWVATTWRPRRIFSWTRFTQLWAFGSRILGSQLFNYVVKNFDTFLIGKMLGPVLLGFYAFGYAMFLTPLIEIALIVGRVAFSAFSRVQHDLARLRQGFLLTSRYVALLAFPALVGLYLISGDVVPLLFGSKWQPAVPVLQVLLIAGVVHAHANIWASAFQALDRAGWLLTWSIISAAIYVPAFVIGLRWGIVGVAAGYTVSTLLLFPLQFRALQRLLDLSLGAYLRALMPVVGACVVMGVTVFLAQSWLTAAGAGAALRVVAAVVVGVLSYGGAILLIQREIVLQLLRILLALRGGRRSRRLAEEVAL